MTCCVLRKVSIVWSKHRESLSKERPTYRSCEVLPPKARNSDATVNRKPPALIGPAVFVSLTSASAANQASGPAVEPAGSRSLCLVCLASCQLTYPLILCALNLVLLCHLALRLEGL